MLETDEKQKDYSLKAKCLLEQLPLIVVRSQARPTPQYTGKKGVSFLPLEWACLFWNQKKCDIYSSIIL